MKYGEHFTITKAVAIVQNMKQWKEKNKFQSILDPNNQSKKEVAPADYTSYSVSLQILKDNNIKI
jgi:hypothetical protein